VKTTQEQVDDLTAKVFRLEAIATRLSKAEKQLTELTRNDSWLADRCKDAADRLAKLESGKAEVQDGRREARRLSAALDMRTAERGRLIDAHTELEMHLARTEEALTRLMAIHGYTGGPGGWQRESGPVWPLETALEGIEAMVRAEREALDMRPAEAGLRAALVAARAALATGRAENEKLRGEIVGLRKRVDVLEVALDERTDELGTAQRLIAETDDIDDDVMVTLGDPVKGAEAEELRKGVEDLIKAADSNDGVVSWHALQSLLDRVNARDSNAFLAHLERAETGKPVPCHRCNASDSERLYFWTCRECLNAQSEKLVDKLDRTLTALAISTSEREEAEARLVEATKTVEARLYRGAHDSITGNREALGRIVRWVWIAWAKEQPNPKPSWLVPWEGLSEPDKEVDRRIGERLAAEGAPGDAPEEAPAPCYRCGTVDECRVSVAICGDCMPEPKAPDLATMGNDLRAAGWHCSPDAGWTKGLDGEYMSIANAHAMMLADCLKAANESPCIGEDPDAKAIDLEEAGWTSHAKGWRSPSGAGYYDTADAHARMLSGKAEANPFTAERFMQLALLNAGWEPLRSFLSLAICWRGPHGSAPCDIDEAHARMLTDRETAKTDRQLVAEFVERKRSATPRDTLAQPEPGDMYVDNERDIWCCSETDKPPQWMAEEKRLLYYATPNGIIELTATLRPATPEEAAKIRKDNGL